MDVLANPVINSPYLEPSRHFVLDGSGRPTGEIHDSRRLSEFFVPVPKPKKGAKAAPAQLAFDLTDEKVERNDAIDQLGRIVLQHAGRVTLRIADDYAAGGVRRVAVDTRQFQCDAVEQIGMQIGARQ